MVVHGRPGFRLTQCEESGVGLNGAYLNNHSIIYLKHVLAKDKRYRDSRRALIRPKEDYGLIGGPDSDEKGNKLFVLPKLTNIITETAESIAESECNRNADSITEMASFITDATK